MRVFLSAGHTRRNPGAIAPGIVAPEFDLNEWLVDLVASEMRQIQPVQVPRVRLRDRIRFINRWSRPGDYALEIHHNTAKSSRANGVEVFAFRGSVGGGFLGKTVLRSIVALGQRNRGVRVPGKSSRGQLGFLSQTKPWAALLEVGFMTNPGFREWLQTGAQDRIAVAIANALDELA